MRKILTVFVAVVIGLTGAVVSASPAHAAFSDCTDNGTRLCIWQGANGTGLKYEFGNSVFPGCNNIGGDWHWTTSSMKMMRAGAKVKFYYNANCVPLDTQTTYFYPISTYNFGTFLNDHVWSFYWTAA